jgi:hypothetical protein
MLIQVTLEAVSEMVYPVGSSCPTHGNRPTCYNCAKAHWCPPPFLMIPRTLAAPRANFVRTVRGLEAATPDELASAAFLHRSACATGRASQNCSWISHYGRRTFRVIEPPSQSDRAFNPLHRRHLLGSSTEACRV